MKVALAAATALVTAGCGGGTAATRSGVDGRTLFVQQCGACHTLAAAGTKGSYGSDLERARPTKAAVLKAIDDGAGTMPADIVGGRDAAAIASYVARAVRR